MLEDIFKRESEILEKIKLIDFEKKELSKKFAEDSTNIKIRKCIENDDLNDLYKRSVKKLFEFVYNLVDNNVEILSRYEGEYEGTSQYKTFSIIGNSEGKISMIPETKNWYDGWNKWLEHQELISIEELMYDPKTKKEHIKKLYKNLKKIVEKNGNN